MRRGLLPWLSCQVLGALALRVPSPGSPAIELDRSTELEDSDTEVGILPPIARFRRDYAKYYDDSSENLQEPLKSSVKLVLGVMTAAQDKDYREVVRNTWIQQAGVCYLSPQPRPGCVVYVAFVIGKNGTGASNRKVNLTAAEVEQAHREKGMFVLDIVENKNGGKSFHWFAAALKKYPWATHIGKMDMDTYPHIHKLVTRMDTNRSCVSEASPYEFIGRPAPTCHDTCVPFSTICPQTDCLGQFKAEFWKADDRVPLGSTQWNFILGEMYIMSMPLVRLLDWTPILGNEDIAMSYLVQKTMKRKKTCVAIRRLDAWFHASNKPRYRPEDRQGMPGMPRPLAA